MDLCRKVSQGIPLFVGLDREKVGIWHEINQKLITSAEWGGGSVCGHNEEFSVKRQRDEAPNGKRGKMTRRSRGRSWAMWQISEELLRPWKQQSRLYFEKVVSWNRSGPDTVNWSDVSSKLWIHAGEKFQRKGRSFKLGCGSSSSELNLRTESGPAAVIQQYSTSHYCCLFNLFKQTSSTCDVVLFSGTNRGCTLSVSVLITKRPVSVAHVFLFLKSPDLWIFNCSYRLYN